jgi:hypothetical protein
LPDARPRERLDKRLRQRQAGRLDDDVVRRLRTVQDLLHRRQEVICDSAADAAIGELDDVARRAGLAATIRQKLTVEPNIAEFIDDQRDTPPARILQQMPDQRGFAGSQKTGDDGGRDPSGVSWRSAQCGVPLRCSGSPAATNTTRSAA